MNKLLLEIREKLLEKVKESADEQDANSGHLSLPIYSTLDTLITTTGTSRNSLLVNTDSSAVKDSGALEYSQDKDSTSDNKYQLIHCVDLDTKNHYWLDMFLDYFIHEEDSAVVEARGKYSGFQISDDQFHVDFDNQEIDDLLFFVRYPHASNRHLDQLFVKRKTGRSVPPLDDLIAWKETFLLNLIIHSKFIMNVCVCKREKVMKPGQANYDDSTLRKSSSSYSITQKTLNSVKKVVFASPYKVQMNQHLPEHEKKSVWGSSSGGKSNEEFSKLSYPILYFCVNDFEDAFEGIVCKPNEFLTVELFLPVPFYRDEGSDSTKPKQPHLITLFQGAVSYSSISKVYSEKVTDSLLSKTVPFMNSVVKRIRNNELARSIIGKVVGSQQHDSKRSGTTISQSPKNNSHNLLQNNPSDNVFINMRGPGGKGHAEVCVSSFEQDGNSDPQTSPSNDEESTRGLLCRMTFISLAWTQILKDLLSESI